MGSVFMMVSAERLMSVKLLVYFSAMVAVRFASTLALMPLPRPSERTAITLSSSLNFWQRTTSPDTSWPCLAVWQSSTSMKLRLIRLAMVFDVFGREGIDDGVERDLGFGGVLSDEVGDLLYGAQVLLDH